MYAHLSRETLGRLAAEARRQGLRVWSHSVVYPSNIDDVLAARPDVISHAAGLLYPRDWVFKRNGSMAIDPTVLESKDLERVLDDMARLGVILDPTLAIFAEQLSYIKDSEVSRVKLKCLFEVVRRARQKRIPVAAGTDFPMPRRPDERPMLLREVELLVSEAGFTPMEALAAATLNGARALGIEQTHGSVEAGKVANLVVLREDPTKDIANLADVRLVIKAGRVVRRQLDRGSQE